MLCCDECAAQFGARIFGHIRYVVVRKVLQVGERQHPCHNQPFGDAFCELACATRCMPDQLLELARFGARRGDPPEQQLQAGIDEASLNGAVDTPRSALALAAD